MTMTTKLVTGESQVAVSYRLTLPDGMRIALMAVPLDDRTAGEVIGSVSTEYTLVIPLFPPGRAWPFLRGMSLDLNYVKQATALMGRHASLLQKLLPSLTLIPPGDDLIDLADEWYTTQKGE